MENNTLLLCILIMISLNSSINAYRAYLSWKEIKIRNTKFGYLPETPTKGTPPVNPSGIWPTQERTVNGCPVRKFFKDA